MNTTKMILRFLTLALGLLLTACHQPYDLYLERTEEDAESSCTAMCYDAVISAETDADGTSGEYSLIECHELDGVDGREMVACTFVVPEE